MDGKGVSDNRRSRRWVVIVLVGIPAWLVASTLFGWWAWNREHQRGEEGAKFAREIDAGSLESAMRKIRDFATPRGVGDEAGRLGLTRMAAMIEGSLGPSNAGYEVRRLQGVSAEGGEWPALQVVVRGDSRPPLWVICPYDEAEAAPDASAVASTMAVATALAGKSLGRPVHFLFVPHRSDPELFGRMERWIARPDVALWIEGTSGQDITLVSGPRKEEQFHMPVAVEEGGGHLPAFVEFGIVPRGQATGDITPATRALAGMIQELAR